MARFSDTSSSIRIIGPWFPFLLGGYYTREDYYLSERRAEVRRERRSCAFEIHAFIQRGPSNPARQEKCYEKWMGQFSISQRLGPRTVGISFYYAYTHIYLCHVRLSRARRHGTRSGRKFRSNGERSTMSRYSRACRPRSEFENHPP